MSSDPTDFEVPPPGQPAFEESAEIDDSPPEVNGSSGSRAEAVRRAHEADLMTVDGVTGVGIGDADLGGDAIVVYVRDAAVGDRLPTDLEGIPVQVVVTGDIEPY